MITLHDWLQIAVGSKNPVKIAAVTESFERLWYNHCTIIWYDHPTMRWISHQPLTKEETLLWAQNRAKYCLTVDTTSSLAFWLEWWVYLDKSNDNLYLFGVVAVVDREWYHNHAFWWDILLPTIVKDRILSWEELWVVMDQTIHTHNIKQWSWTIWYLTKWILNRQKWFHLTAIQAIVPRLHTEMNWY